MQNINIQIAAIGDPKTFPELEKEQFIPGEIVGMTILEAGMQSGSVSVALHIKHQLQSKTVYSTSQLSAAMFFSLAAGIKGACDRFNDQKSLEAYLPK